MLGEPSEVLPNSHSNTTRSKQSQKCHFSQLLDELILPEKCCLLLRVAISLATLSNRHLTVDKLGLKRGNRRRYFCEENISEPIRSFCQISNKT